MFDTLLLFFLPLIFTMFSATFGQRGSGPQDGESLETADTALGTRAAETAGKQEVSRNINKGAWLIGGGAGCIVSCIIGVLLGILIGGLIDPTVPSDFMPMLNTGALIGGMIGLVLGMLAPFIWIYCVVPHPPEQSLVGKSPEYAAAYTAAYRSKLRWTRILFASTGIPIVLIGASVILTIAS